MTIKILYYLDNKPSQELLDLQRDTIHGEYYFALAGKRVRFCGVRSLPATREQRGATSEIYFKSVP